MNKNILALSILAFSAQAFAMDLARDTALTRYFKSGTIQSGQTNAGVDYLIGVGHDGVRLVYDRNAGWHVNHGITDQDWRKTERPVSPVGTRPQLPTFGVPAGVAAGHPSPGMPLQPIARRDGGTGGRNPRTPQNTSLLRNQIVKLAILAGGAWGVKKVYNYWSTSTQRKIQQLIADAQKLLQEVTPAYTALFEADDAAFMQTLQAQENHEQLSTNATKFIERIQAILKTLELLSKNLKATKGDRQLQTNIDIVTSQLTLAKEKLAIVNKRINVITKQQVQPAA